MAGQGTRRPYKETQQSRQARRCQIQLTGLSEGVLSPVQDLARSFHVSPKSRFTRLTFLPLLLRLQATRDLLRKMKKDSKMTHKNNSKINPETRHPLFGVISVYIKYVSTFGDLWSPL